MKGLAKKVIEDCNREWRGDGHPAASTTNAHAAAADALMALGFKESRAKP